MDIGDSFQQDTKYYPDRIKGHSLDWENRPDQGKIHDHPITIITLPEPVLSKGKNLWKALQDRRSRRKFNHEMTLKLEILSTLLWSVQGITARYGNTFFRTAPSAGALYPVETYIISRAVDGLKSGLYHFRPVSFDLELLREGDYSFQLSEAALGQLMISRAQVTFIWSAVIQRAKWKYRERAYRYIYLDVGHIAQNLYLAAEALDLSTCTIGAFFDDEINSIIGADGIDETALYLAPVGFRE